MLVLKRHYQFWFSILALHKIGAIVVPATNQLVEHDFEYRFNAGGISAIVCTADGDVAHQVDLAAEKSETLKTKIIAHGKRDGWRSFDEEYVEFSDDFERPSAEEGAFCYDPMLMFFTSGTTGYPKIAMHSHRYPLGHFITAKYWHNLNEDSLHLTLADTGWGKAVWGKYYGQWIVGANVFVYDYEKFTPVDLLAIFEKYHITSFCAPPTVFRFLIREDISKYDLSALRYCTIAGEALNPSVYEKWKELTGIKLFEAFGQTETTITVGTYPMVEPRPGSMGKKGPVYDIDLMKPDGTWAEDGEQGEIVIRTHGKHPVGLFKEYYRDPELTKEAYDNGIYHTGDVAWRDEDGYYWFIGRKDDVIKSSGYRIGPFEVESALMTHPAVVECAITGVPDEIRGQVVKATIVLSADYKDKAGEALIAEIQDHVKRTTAPYKYPRIIEFVDELPKTISGKIRRVEIRKKNNQ
jgi:acetyl-CoA synthetase